MADVEEAEIEHVTAERDIEGGSFPQRAGLQAIAGRTPLACGFLIPGRRGEPRGQSRVLKVRCQAWHRECSAVRLW